MLFLWRNDTLTRAMSHNAEPVAWESHVAWLAARLARSDPRLYVAESDGQPVGTLRVDGDEISYTIAPESRGRGICQQMLAVARQALGPLRADIYARNIPSIKAAERAGFRVNILTDVSGR